MGIGAFDVCCRAGTLDLLACLRGASRRYAPTMFCQREQISSHRKGRVSAIRAYYGYFRKLRSPPGREGLLSVLNFLFIICYIFKPKSFK